MNPTNRLEQLFSSFPGIGPRQAKRFVNFIISRPESFTNEFVSMIDEVRKSSTECVQCHRFFLKKNSSNSSQSNTENLNNTHNHQDKVCNICSDPNRDNSQLMIISSDSDFETIEKSGLYNGLYFILGGIVPVLDKEPEKRIRLNKLLERISSNKNTKEIILSLSTTPEGEHTANITKEAIQNIQNNKNSTINNKLLITILGRGLSTGAELEYADTETIKNALKNRR